MDLIVAILLFLNIINPGDTPTQEVIDANQSSIERYTSDPEFMQMYQNDGIVVFDIEGGD